jgi:ABC-2 type transport system permease protein
MTSTAVPGRGLIGTGALIRLAWRRDRILAPVWIAVFVMMASFSAATTIELYPTLTSRVEAAAAVNGTPALVALYGRIYDPTSLGALSLIKLNAMGAAMVAVLAIILVVRHSRSEEEAGRLELVGATVVGRRAPLVAAMALATTVCGLLGLTTALGLVAAGLPVDGSVIFGLGWALTGITFAAIAAVTAQLVISARAAVGITSVILAAAYALRAIGDTAPADGPRWLSWLSPVAWGQQARPFAGDRWLALVLPVALSVVAFAVAHRLSGRRDLGRGMLPERAGPARGSAWLGSPLALAWRLQAGVFLGWFAAFVLLGGIMGSIAMNVEEFINSDQARELFSRLGGHSTLTDVFLATELGMFAVFVSAFGVQAALRLRSEETRLRAEPVLAAPVGRLRWFASHVLVAFGGAAALLLTGGLAVGASWAYASGDTGQIGRVLAGAAVQIPSVWLVTSIVVAAFGIVPRAVMIGWAGLVGFLLIGELGPMLRLDQWVLNLSPYVHTPRLPGSEFTATPLLWMLAITAVLVAVGALGFRRRDLG